MNKMRRTFFIVLAIVILHACATVETGGLETIPVLEGEETPGLFTVIFAGRHYSEEVDAVVVLDLEGDEYTFVPEAAKKDFEVLNSISIEEAFYEAEPFFRLHPAFTGQTRLLRIQDPDGDTIGYELRPLYHPDWYGEADVVRTNYEIESGNRVVFSTRAKYVIVP